MYLRQAIQTRWIPPTNKKGARVSAQADGGRVVVSWDHSLNVDGNHIHAATTLANKLGWPTDIMVGGGLPKSNSYCFVFNWPEGK